MRSVMRGLLTLAALTALTCSFASATAVAAPAPSAATTSTTSAVTPATVHSCAQNVTPGMATCFALRRTDAGVHHSLISPDATPSGYGPANLQSAYKLPSTTIVKATEIAPGPTVSGSVSG